MSNNTANTIMFIAWFGFIALLMYLFSPWFVLLVIISPTFRTDKEIEARTTESTKEKK